jgi:hypothetical protein
VLHDPDFARDPEIARGKILSITDEKVEDAARTAKTQPADPPQSSPAETSSDGWVARRPGRARTR